jgi:2',3'-cyclic-nucleotide 2'-phosphodiesterase (5'-nucleotidase family)
MVRRNLQLSSAIRSLLLLAVVAASKAANSGLYELTLLHTNDLHSRFDQGIEQQIQSDDLQLTTLEFVHSGVVSASRRGAWSFGLWV